MVKAQRLGQAGRFLAKQEKASVPEGGLGILPGGLGGGQPQVGVGVALKESVQRGVDRDVHHVPVVQSGPLDGLFRNIKAQGFDQVQAAAGGGTGAGNVAAVLRDLRFYQNDVEHAVHLGFDAQRGTMRPQTRLNILCQSFPKINPKNPIFRTFS